MSTTIPAVTKPHAIYGIEGIEQGAIDQFVSAMAEDFAVRGAMMPDAHAGYSLLIGGVVATRGKIVPAWVGYDIGCGMSAILTPFVLMDLTVELRERIFASIYRSIPTGVGGQHREPQEWQGASAECSAMLRDAYDRKGTFQLGSLGSGNHFLEIGHDELNRLWIVVHSGSRGLGHAAATHYMKRASGSEKPLEGHFAFDVTSEEGRAYIADMEFCLAYAIENRERMIRAALKDMNHALRGEAVVPDDVDWDIFINRNHNHAVLRNVGGENLWIHRKGATHAEAGMMGVIPGHMRAGSFIVCGSGNPDSLWSSSHGAGRRLGRQQALRELDIDQFRDQMAGITALVDRGTLDEAPDAYKDIFTVMEMQADLVEVLHHVKPVINIKAKGEERRKKKRQQDTATAGADYA